MNNLVKRNNISYDPFVDFYNMETFFPTMGQQKSFPSVNISEDDKNYCVDVVAPGFKKEDFKINVDDDMLTISAEAKSEYSNMDENNNQENEKNTKNQSKSQEKQSGSTSNESRGSNGSKRQYSRREYSYSSFTRSFRLPENTKDDKITAKYNDGILELMIPKSKEEEKATKQIQVS